jgi:hypothetical protein
VITDQLPPSLAQSSSFNKIVNPSGHPVGLDIHSITVPSSKLPKDDESQALTDKEVLARLTRGFYAGRVLTPERWALRFWGWMGGAPLLDIGCVRGDAARVNKNLWTATDIIIEESWAVGTILSSSFQVGSVGFSEDVSRSGDGARESHIDFLFGSDNGKLKGLHRLSVIRHQEVVNEKEQEVCELRLTGVSGNPTARKPLHPWIFRFHMLYARLLFREAVSEVLAPSL